ncbi:ribose 5-phosphate isomerase B [Spiroplasma cantharicola]|uniref:Ribose-5-phosphate isomerase B n=1 Tax=Spiroplasma cantharicola TaxID=362837 RepID=A0A0M3SJ16_9MOLU|nr:ribose 5-phosphate isomerase B [Spiroplasma cantharicola]ALD65958.1 ribose-5-phosphate isomerase B [Spiroplasma cantharicola]
MKIYIGNDHAGVDMKNHIVKYLKSNGYEVINIGTDNEDSVDYPDFGKEVAKKVVENKSFGIVICGTGIGISIAANKVKGARAALCYEDQTTILARQHNNANILALGARMIANEKAVRLVDIFLNTKFEERHKNRVEKLNNQ